jgi:spoIIIJ-associated protein
MSASMEYKGDDVEEAIVNACTALGVVREDLDIQVIHTGSAGIFGLGRKKAVIRVSLRAAAEPAPEPAPDLADEAVAPAQPPQPAREPRPPRQQPPAPQQQPALPAAKPAAKPAPGPAAPPAAAANGDDDEVETAGNGGMEPLTAAELAAVRATVERLLELSTGTAKVEVAQDEGGGKLRIDLDGGPERERLIGPNGQTLDAIQYLLRKMLSKQLGKRVALELDAAGFRAERRQALETQALSLAATVKSSGKSRTMPAMGPAERRIVHLALQDDSEIRSRSVGEGVFKKILVHLPGKSRPPRRKR